MSEREKTSIDDIRPTDCYYNYATLVEIAEDCKSLMNQIDRAIISKWPEGNDAGQLFGILTHHFESLMVKIYYLRSVVQFMNLLIIDNGGKHDGQRNSQEEIERLYAELSEGDKMNKTTNWWNTVRCPHCGEGYYPGNFNKNEIVKCHYCGLMFKIQAKIINVKREVYRSEKVD